MGWIITFLILFLLAILPLGVSILYDADGFRAKVIAGPVRFTVFPFPKRKKKEKPPKQKKTDSKAETKPAKQEPAAEKKPEAKPKKSGGSWKDFLPLVSLGLEFLGDFRRKLRLSHLVLRVILAGDDPCDVAVNYGRIWAAIANLLPRLERVFVIGKRDIEVECDFMSSDTVVTARLDISITLGRLLSLVVVYGVRGLIVFLKIRKKRKGGAVS